MADVVIRRCVMRVVRHGGWSWGGAPRRLVDDAVRALPALVSEELMRLLPEDADGEISAPLRVEVKTSLAELARWSRRAAGMAAATGDAATAAGAGAPASLPDLPEIAEGLRRGLATMRLAERVVVSASPAHVPIALAKEPDAGRQRADVLALLVAWHAADGLEPLLSTLADAVVIAWHRAVFDARVPAPAGGDEPMPPGAAAAMQALAARGGTSDRMPRLRLRLLAAAELALRFGTPASRPAARTLIESVLPETLPSSPTPAPPQAPARPVAAATRAAAGSDQRISSALPFLLLGPLHRIGWLGLLDATLAGAQVSALLPALAAALAIKALPEPERGWRRTPDALRTAATFAGDAEPQAGDGSGLARALGPLMPALDAVLRRALVDGHAPGTPLLLCAVDGVQLLVDPPGVFLVGYATHDAGLAAQAAETRAPVFVPEDDASLRMLAALDAAGVAFVTPARPVRGEHWLAVPHTHAPRLFSNRTTLRVTPPPATVAERARDTWRSLARRPAPGHASDPAFDRSLSLAAALALGTLAWELWRDREPTDPMLALERFGDLDGTVHFDATTVRVRLPLGRRFGDLKKAGLLADVPRVPWLDGRTVVFTGG